MAAVTSKEQALDLVRKAITDLEIGGADQFLVAVWKVEDDGKIRTTSLISRTSWQFPHAATGEAVALLQNQMEQDMEDAPPAPLKPASFEELQS